MYYYTIFLCISTSLSTIYARPYGKSIGTKSKTIHCEPQRTPMYGSKWCNFIDHQSEVGSICEFSCIEGYHLRGAKSTECILDSSSTRPYYNDTIGFCEPNAPLLREGKNGPYLVHSYDPSTYVIHVGATKEVTLKSYYYLALYVESPGLNGVENTVSFLVEGVENKYIMSNGTHVYTENLLIDDTREKDHATFLLKENEFFQGYAAFESYNHRGYYLLHKSRKIILSQAKDLEDYVCASFIWSPDL